MLVYKLDGWPVERAHSVQHLPASLYAFLAALRAFRLSSSMSRRTCRQLGADGRPRGGCQHLLHCHATASIRMCISAPCWLPACPASDPHQPQQEAFAHLAVLRCAWVPLVSPGKGFTGAEVHPVAVEAADFRAGGLGCACTDSSQP